MLKKCWASFLNKQIDIFKIHDVKILAICRNKGELEAAGLSTTEKPVWISDEDPWLKEKEAYEAGRQSVLIRPEEPQCKEDAEITRLANFILKLDMGHPVCTEQKPTGESAVDAAIAIIMELKNKPPHEPAAMDFEALRAARDAIQDFCNSGDEVSWEEAVNVLAPHHETITQLLDAAIERGE